MQQQQSPYTFHPHPTKSQAPGSIISLTSTFPNSNPNPIHQYYNQLLSDCDYPNLKRILFLQLVTKENVLIYSKRRAEIKEAWLGLEKKIQRGRFDKKSKPQLKEGYGQEKANRGGLYIVDGQTKLQDIFSHKEEDSNVPKSSNHPQKTQRLPTNSTIPTEKRFLLFDLGTVNTASLNYLLNATLTNFTILAVEPQSRPIRPQLSDIFPLVFLDEIGQDSTQDEHIEYNKHVGSVAIENDKFQYARELNFNLSLQASKHQQCFFKVYCSLLKQRSSKKGIILPHSRWKKMPKILYLLGITRIQSLFKSLSPVDCLYAPSCLGRTPEEINALTEINQEILRELVPMYGIERWMKQLQNHFWIWKEKKRYLLSLFQKIKGKVSFYYPCVKYSQIVELRHDNLDTSLHYKIKGQQKKLLSDKYYKIGISSSLDQPQRQYRLSFQYRTKYNVITHVGIACFDSNRQFISPVQVCRIENSDVVVQKIEGDRIVIDVDESSEGQSVLGKWSGTDSYGYERCIGFYFDGNLQKCITTDSILSEPTNPYSKQPKAGAYTELSSNIIHINPLLLSNFQKISQKIIPHTTKIMNHYQGGTYAIGCSLKGQQQQWKNVQMVFKGEGRSNNGHQFLYGTKEVRIVILVNYNSGFPEFKIQKKDAEVQIRNIEWISL